MRGVFMYNGCEVTYAEEKNTTGERFTGGGESRTRRDDPDFILSRIFRAQSPDGDRLQYA